MRVFQILCLAVAAVLAFQTNAGANDRYRQKPPVVLSPDLAAPWVMQLKPKRRAIVPRRATRQRTQKRTVRQRTQQRTVRRNTDQLVVRQRAQRRTLYTPLPRARRERTRPSFVIRKKTRRNSIRTATVRVPSKKTVTRSLDPVFLPQNVSYDTGQKPGTIVIDTNERFLYLVQSNGEARRYGVGVGKPGFEWAGTHKITQKKHWPDWRPPAEMIARERKKGRNLPNYMPGGPSNPLGARALYLGSTLSRIHGTNAPWTIGQAVSSGCLRMRNEDVVDLYERVGVGTRVVVM
jgi:lipoprotein-anchoring transpeptidase ErfK/SrfK